MIRGTDINTVLNNCKNCFGHAIFYKNRMMSKVITKHLCNYTKRFYKLFYRVILTNELLRIFRFKT